MKFLLTIDTLVNFCFIVKSANFRPISTNTLYYIHGIQFRLEYIDTNQAKKALVSLAIETVLLEIGKPTYDEVSHKLFKVYKCYLPDCYEHPEYLKKILQDLYGVSTITIFESIKNQLEEFGNQSGVDFFIAGISA